MISEHALGIGGREKASVALNDYMCVYTPHLLLLEELELSSLLGSTLLLGIGPPVCNCAASDVGGIVSPVLFQYSFTLASSHVSPSGTPHMVHSDLYLLNIGPFQNWSNSCGVAGTQVMPRCFLTVTTNCDTLSHPGMV